MLAGAAALGGAGALLAACGGGDDGTDSSSLITTPQDTTGQAKRGGTIRDRAFSDPPSLDVHNFFNPLNPVVAVYSALFQFKPGLGRPAENELAGDLIEAWERSPDGLQYTLKVRPGVKWHNKPPVNGRAFEVEDAVFTWNRYATVNTSRAAIANSVSPSAPVISLTAADARTLVLKLAEPIVYGLGLFTPLSAGHIWMMPKETDSAYDVRSDMIGTGPWVLSSYVPSASFSFRRNPDYYDRDIALAEQLEMPIVTEYATTLAQFKAGNLFSFGGSNAAPKITPEDVLATKREVPQILIYAGGVRAVGQARHLAFGWLPAGRSPFIDERVRQAVSMAIDRDLYLETFGNASTFTAEGLPVELRWNTALTANIQGSWLDPKGKDFGPNARFLRHDPAEAKKLLAAAGFPNGIQNLPSRYVATSEFPSGKHAEIYDAMIAEVGITSRVDTVDYAKEYIPQYRNGQGQHDGWLYRSTAGGFTGGEAAAIIATEYWAKAGVTFYGFSTSGQNDKAGDPQVNSLIEKARLEPDTEKRRALVFELQRYLAKAAYAVPPPGQATAFEVAWPALRNFGAFQGVGVFQGARPNYGLWVDDTKPPLGKA